MRAIALNAVILAICGASAAVADTHADIADMFASMTAALADDNVAGFMHGFDKNMPAYDTLTGYMDAMVAAAEVTSAIDSIKDEGDEAKRVVDVDWTLQIRSRQQAGPLIQREQTVHAELVRDNKRWRIVSISPLEFFAPPKFSESK
jgi:hypothetical protein